MRAESRGLGIGAERELQNRHAWEIELLADGFYRGGDDAEILGHQRQVAQRGLGGLEPAGARSLSPTAARRGPLRRRQFPDGLQAAELVEPCEIAPVEHGAAA